jgi:ribosomal protein S18 acetylase RimI-like enzyme
MRRMPPPPPSATAEAVLATFRRAPGAHPYGIADVAQLWDVSRWWQEGHAVVGLIVLPGSPVPVLYAVAAEEADRTLALLRRLAPALPGRFMATGPVGMTAALADGFDAAFTRPYLKMHLADPDRLPPVDGGVVTLDRRDRDDLEALFATDPVAGDFFHAGLLDTGCYVGWRDAGELVAAGGIHIMDERQGVAAIGNLVTHPARRGRGLGRAVLATLCHRLLARVPLVGLNVRKDNVVARSLYESVGFVVVLPYEEAALIRR